MYIHGQKTTAFGLTSSPSPEPSRAKPKEACGISFLYFCCICIVFFLTACQSNRPKDVNVFLITIDTLWPDHLGCYGYKRNTSPNIDNLAKEGVLFKQAISQSSWTPPAIFSIITSLYPIEHKVFSFGIPLEHGVKTIFEILKNKSYYLGFISSRGALAELHFSDIEKLFDYFYPYNSNYIKADEITNEAIRWLEENKQKKLFLWLYYSDPHAPYNPPAPYNNLYIDDEFSKQNNREIPIADNSRQIYDGNGVIPRFAAIKNIRGINYYIAQYDGEIRFVDDQIGRLSKALEHLQLPRDTLIIITADHGEYLGEHDFYFAHGDNLYDVLIRVPLIFKCSSLFKKGRVISQQVASIDIMPTILGALNIKPGINMSGINLMPIILKGSESLSVRPIFSEFIWKDLNGQGPIQSIKISMRSGGWKLIYDALNKESKLFNLEKDAGETINLVDTETVKFKSMKKDLNNYMKKQKWMHSININPHINEEVKDKLRSLGYLQ